jgi:tryptophan halogenase
MVEFYRENGPSAVATDVLLKPTNSFGIDGYQAMLVGQRVPHAKPHVPSAADLGRWHAYQRKLEAQAKQGIGVAECLEFIRSRGVR